MDFNIPVYNEHVNYKCLLGLEHNTSDLYLNYCGIEYCNPCHKYEHISRKEHLIHIVTDGTGTFYLDGKTFSIHKGQVFYIPPDDTDYFYIADRKTPWTYMWIGFSGTKSDFYLEQTGLSVLSPLCNLDTYINDLAILMQKLLQAKTLSYSNELKRIGYLYKIISLLISANNNFTSDIKVRQYSSTFYAIYAKEYIDNFYVDTNISKLADILGIGRSYLYTVFKNTYNISPYEYLISVKMKTAAQLLLDSNLPIKMISLHTGYEDALCFSKAFKKAYGMCPSHYRTINQKKE
jgi:AraC-type DNA-binding domain-containing proteins